MSKLSLPDVTAICVDGFDAARTIPILERCKELVNFGAVKLLSHLEVGYPRVAIQPIKSINDYSGFLLKEIYKYVDTPYLLTIQWDGWVLNPDMWNPAWTSYDYIGPLFLQDKNITEYSVGSGGFSLRSRALMEFVSSSLPAWGPDGRTNWGHEDGVIVHELREKCKAHGFRYAPPEVACVFAQGGNTAPAYYVERPFGFHGFWENINYEAGLVGPWKERD